jgi:hypothetical protein
MNIYCDCKCSEYRIFLVLTSKLGPTPGFSPQFTLSKSVIMPWLNIFKLFYQIIRLRNNF